MTKQNSFALSFYFKLTKNDTAVFLEKSSNFSFSFIILQLNKPNKYDEKLFHIFFLSTRFGVVMGGIFTIALLTI